MKHKLIISHINFSEPHKAPFNIEYDTYGKWCELIRENIKPAAYCYGHVHQNYVSLPGSEKDIFNQGAPAIVAGIPVRQENETGFTGAAITLSDAKITVSYINHAGDVAETIEIPR